MEKSLLSRGKVNRLLSSISFSLEPGEILGILCRPGPEKTALIRCLTLMDTPTKGYVSLNQKRLSDLPKSKLRSVRPKIGLVTQHNHFMMTKSVSDNLRLPLLFNHVPKEEQNSQIKSVLRLVHLEDCQQALPQELSSLQKYRLAIARCLINHPAVIYCDDIANTLDRHWQTSLFELLEALAHKQGIAFVYLTQDFHAIKHFAKKVGVFAQGKLAEIASPLELYLHPKSELTREYWKTLARQELPNPIQRITHPVPYDNATPIVRIVFSEDLPQEPLFGYLIDKFHISINIIQAYREPLQDHRINAMLVEMTDRAGRLEDALAFLQEKKFYTEVIGYARHTL